MSMDPIDQQLALAKVHRPDLMREHAKADKRLKKVKNGVYPIIELEDFPDYLSDLNAVREIEVRLSTSKKHEVELSIRERFELILARITDSSLPISASAPQRCEAILKALNLWKD